MVTQLIYMSQPFGFDDSILSGILSIARRNNSRHDVTGALICRHDVYLQLIEGATHAVDNLFERISTDDRHLAVTLLNRAEVSERLFPDWAMLHDPAHSWHWSPEEVSNGAISDASLVELQEIFVQAAVAQSTRRPGE